MSAIESAQADYIYYQKKYAKVSSEYHKSLMLNARDRLQRLQWEQERAIRAKWARV